MKHKYAWQQVVLHWLSAVIIIWATFSGFYVAMFDVSAGIKDWVGFFNVSLTAVFIPFFALRVWYLLRLGKPTHEQPLTLANRAADIAHLLLYINIAVVLISGVLMMERDINIFNLLSIPQPINNLAVTQQFNIIHIISCISLAGLVLLHVLAVIKHEFCGNRILRKMWL